jgi:hypothetical protein
MIHKAQEASLIVGLVPHLIEKGVAIMQYADDTILLIQEELTQVTHLKLILYMFEAMSGLKTNFDKSEIMMVLEDQEKSLFYAEMFGCQVGDWPAKYLGVPVSGSRILVKDEKPLIDKLQKKLDGWVGNSFSIGGRWTLIQSSLSGSLIYHMSIYLLSDTSLGNRTKIIRRFFWAGTSPKRKYYMVRWPIVCKPKSKGGLGIKNLKMFNICLLCKWWWQLESGEGLWQSHVKANYKITHGIWRVNLKANDSPVWRNLLRIKGIYLQGRKMVIGNGKSTDFWHDAWCGVRPLCEQFPLMFSVNDQQS